jgi:hypothetical protein
MTNNTKQRRAFEEWYFWNSAIEIDMIEDSYGVIAG